MPTAPRPPRPSRTRGAKATRSSSPLAPLEMPRARPHDLDIARIDQEIARLSAPRRLRCELPVKANGPAEPRSLPLYWWRGAWSSDALVAVRFGGRTVYARSLRVENGDIGRVAELLAENPAAVLDDHEGDGRFRGKRPLVIGWAERVASNGQISWLGIRVDAAALNCSPDISPLIRQRLDELAQEREELIRCNHREPSRAPSAPIDLWMPNREVTPTRDGRHRIVEPPPAFAGAALLQAELAGARAARAERIEADLRRVEGWRNKPILFAGRMLGYLRDAGITDRLFPVARRWIEAVDDRLKARAIARRLGRLREIENGERTRLEAEFAEQTSFFLNDPVDPSHEVGAKIHATELASMRGELDRLRRRNRAIRWIGDIAGAALPTAMTVVSTGALPVLTAASALATLPTGILVFAVTRAVIYKMRKSRGEAHAAYIRAAAAARRGDANAVFDAMVTGNAALERVMTTRPFVPDPEAPLRHAPGIGDPDAPLGTIAGTVGRVDWGIRRTHGTDVITARTRPGVQKRD